MIEKVRLGVITSSHGIKGEAKVYPTTDNISHFKEIEECFLVSEDEKYSVKTKLENFRQNKNMLICKFEIFSTPEEIMKYRKFGVYVDRNSLPELLENENYIGDLIGLKVIDEYKKNLGTVLNIFDTGANQVMEVELINAKKVLFPYIKECILDVNLKEEYILVKLLDGILDLQY